jgi:nucleoside-diphosphate-sugar epimerase
VMRVMASGCVTTFPADPSARLHLTPLEFVVDAAVRALSMPWTIGRTFHLTTPNPPTVAQVFASSAFAAAGLPLPRLCPPADFDPAACGARERELLESVSYCFPYFNSHRSFELKNTRRLLALPAADAALLNRFARHADAGRAMQRQAV